MRCTCGQDNTFRARQCQRCRRRLILGMVPRRFAVDAGAAAGLVLALALVFLFDPGNEASTQVVEVEPLRLAVTPPVFDDMGKLLETFGEGYQYDEIPMDDVLDPRVLSRYDVVFLTSGYVPSEWTGKRLRGDSRGGDVNAAREDLADRIRNSLRTYVAGGGTLYVSDWQFQLLSIAFKELVNKDKLEKGKMGSVRADVVDSGLRRLLGRQIELHFDKDEWRPAAFAGQEVNTLLVGTFTTASGRQMTAPLLVEFPHGDGNVIFTSFHNEKQDSETEQKLLRHLVFTTVTAQTDARIQQTMLRGGFSPVDRNLLSASGQQKTDAQTYDCPGQRHLQFVLGFANRGAELTLTVTSPGGRVHEKTGRSTLTIDIPRAEKGQWKYTATAVRVPYENFPFTLTVGQK